MAKLNDFIAQVKSEGLMKSNRYITQMNMPTGMMTGGFKKSAVKQSLNTDNLQGGYKKKNYY